MTNSKVILDTINVLTRPICFDLFQIIAKKPINYTDLIACTNLKNHSLSKNLECLLKYSLVKIDFREESIAYKSTEFGKKLRDRLQYMVSDFDEISQNIPSKFILDSASFLKLYEKNNLDTIKKIFRGGKIIFSNDDFIILTEHAEKSKDNLLENFLYEDKKILVAKSYQNPTNGVRTEFYLRRVKKLSQEKSQLIAIALDLDAGIITTDRKIIKHAKEFGVLSIDTEKIFKLDRDRLIKRFYEFATTK